MHLPVREFRSKLDYLLYWPLYIGQSYWKASCRQLQHLKLGSGWGWYVVPVEYLAPILTWILRIKTQVSRKGKTAFRTSIEYDEDEDKYWVGQWWGWGWNVVPVEYLAPIRTLAPSHPIENVGQKNVNVLNWDLVEERKTTKRHWFQENPNLTAFIKLFFVPTMELSCRMGHKSWPGRA